MTLLSDEDVQGFLRELQQDGFSELVFPGKSPRIVPADADDDAVVHTAVIGQAQFLCTLNRHLFAKEVEVYCRMRGVVVVPDVDLLGSLRGDPTA